MQNLGIPDPSFLWSWSPVKGLLPLLFAGLVLCSRLAAQTPAQYQQILDRLDRLEQQNRALMEEVRQLRSDLAATRTAPPAKVEEQVAIQQQRIEEQAQIKVEASQRFPLRVTGMALFNTFLNSSLNGGSDYPSVASLGEGDDHGGATVRQTVLGLEYSGPQTLWGGKVSGSLFMDFFGGTAGQALNQDLRVRTASIEVDWKSRSVMAGVEKPIFNPREPNSLAQVGVSPLTGAGNLWLWIPQVRFEQKLKLGEQTAVRAQVGMVGTREALNYQAGGAYNPSLEDVRPGLEGRFEFSHGAEDGRRLEIAPGFHTSVTHVAGTSVPSNLVSLDWFFNPLRKLEFTGAYFSGQNVAHLGTGGTRQGFTILPSGIVIPVHSRGGWGQWTWRTTSRLSFNFFGGQQDDRDTDLLARRVGNNRQYGANFFYRLAPNVLVSFQASQLRTTYLNIGNRLQNHYDLALAYLF